MVGQLRARQVEIEDAIFDHVRKEVSDPVGLTDGEYIVGLRAAVAAAVEYGLESIERAGDRLPPVPPPAGAQARRAARNGASLDTVLLRYTVGSALLEDFILQEAESGGLLGEPGALRQLLGLHAMALRRLTVGIAEEYHDEHERIARSPGERRAELVRALLAGEQGDVALLDYDFEGWHIGVIATAAGAARVVRAIQSGLPCRLLTVMRGETVWAWLGSRRQVDGVTIERLLEGRLPDGVSLAVGEPGEGIVGWRATHRQAQEAMIVALRAPGRPILHADASLLALLLADPARARSFVEMHLSPLERRREGGEALRRTLRAYFHASHNINATAAALGVDRSTVRRRIRMVEEVIGVRLERRHAELAIALRLQELERIDIRPPLPAGHSDRG